MHVHMHFWQTECPTTGCTVTLSETDEACPFVAEITVCVGVEDLAGCWAAVADVTGTEYGRGGGLLTWVVQGDEGFGGDRG